jgi:hypothetical protein
MESNWTSSFPESFYVNDSLLQKIPNIKNFDQFVFLANKYRNIFQNNYVYKGHLSYEKSYDSFFNLKKDNSRVMYAISYNEEWIGHFGLKNVGDKNILLDHALRFSAKGGKSLFKDINKALIELIGKYLPDYNILIIVKKSNKLAFNLHANMNFKDCSKIQYKKLSIDHENYSVMILEKTIDSIN